MADIRIAIDRGGTFCDVIATDNDGRNPIIFKLLSEDPANYTDAPTEAIRRILEIVEGKGIPVGEKLDGSRIASCRIGTTVATNALLTGSGAKFVFATTEGFKDVCVIGDQSRPKLFDLQIRKAKALHSHVVEIGERITIEDYDLNPFPQDKAAEITNPDLVRTSSGEIIRILKKPDCEVVRKQLEQLKREGYDSIAISFMHAYLFPDHEDIVADIAKEVGFQFVTTSAQTSPTIKFLDRSQSTCSEAYLYPIIQQYVHSFQQGFKILPKRVEFMCSDGGLTQANKFRGNAALLSGPAGGVVGIARSCFDGTDGTPLIGFDMGGTSTDVSRFDGFYDLLSHASIAGRTITMPMLNINTVAAGGGSILFARNGLLTVGPDSAGAHPGPACYRKGGPLTVTDANLFLGRLVLSKFPSIFGDKADQPLDVEVVTRKFRDLTRDFNRQTSQTLTAEELAIGFLNIANETMSRPIRSATEARGFAPENHHLVSFGGAGGQHACALSDKLGIKRVLIHKWSSLLSAYGISQAELGSEALEPFAAELGAVSPKTMDQRLSSLREAVKNELISQGAEEPTLKFDESLVLKYFGTDTNLSISRPADGDYATAFKSRHLREFAFSMERKIIIESLKVRGTGSAGSPTRSPSPLKELASNSLSPAEPPNKTQKVYLDKGWHEIGVYELEHIPVYSVVYGPALIIDKTQTILVESSFKAHISSTHVVLEKLDQKDEAESELQSNHDQDMKDWDPIQLSVFANRFMAIAEQMGNTLQRTSISSSIKERLDFSCAIFSPAGKLVANAPHIPIHLGSMQFAIQAQHRHWQGKLQPGDVLLTNHPQWGGTHLPDLTVVSPVFIDTEVAFYVASRGHHTDIGGKGITSMMPESRELWEEGIIIPSSKIVSGGRFLEDEVRAAFEKAGSYPGCSMTRRLSDNISDLKAQISANQRGSTLLQRLCSESSLSTVHKYMTGIQANAESAVRTLFRQIAIEHPYPLTATDYLDDGTIMRVTITLDPHTGGALYDFTGTSPQIWGNYNCPPSITHSAVIYTLRCLIDLDIPLNEGCLAPCEIRVPKGSVLNPSSSVAICGSTLASQRVIDLLLRAFSRYKGFGASQGCANALGWGMGGKNLDTGKIEPGWNYGESIGGGVGAGEGYDGEHAVHVHSTNTKQTDSEVIEKRTAVLVRSYKIRERSGGNGRWKGGNGITREIEARIPLKFSILSERRVYRAWGMAGGMAGKKGENYLFKFGNGESEDQKMDKINLGGKAIMHLQPGEYIQINTPGGGGYGRIDRIENDDVEADFHQAYT
ncbi:Hydantoinase B/oxoprolinase-domain-containing protein [Dendryphion nanum]|uniref:Hydantoinase B/oxoprolinase-domain-containing protein n=1 Tax=Dendryphion nanum TaxID=256645 RepID=A0A9P9ELW7_9PLEO|nr:Hydantoinase B/oxoprolinase-domain-containing protein [Dendryphion nanum]